MKYPSLNPLPTTVRMIDTFRGYNHNEKIRDGEWYDTQNITTKYYPMFANRAKRGTVHQLANGQGMLAKEKLAYVDNNRLYYDGAATPVKNLTAGEKQLVSFGAYICVFPDGRYYNTADPTDYGWMDSEYTTSGNIYYSSCLKDGTTYTQTVATTAPSSPANGQYWLDTSETPYVLKRYSEALLAWVTVSRYTKIKFMTRGVIPADFAEGDGIEVTTSDATMAEKLGLEWDEKISKYKKYFTIVKLGGSTTEDDWIVIQATLEATTNSTAVIKISRSLPQMDYVVNLKNRLWGCYYGQINGEMINEIYCCALGDFKNWSKYEGLSTDSFTASVGTDGPWTGAASFMGYALFFKDDHIHTVAVSAKGAHEISDVAARGVQLGCSDSLQMIDGTLFYKSKDGVCAYQGGAPVLVSQALGDVKYYDAAAGAFGQNYYISMRDSSNNWNLFVYDTAKRLWAREDDSHALWFGTIGEELYMMTSDFSIVALNGTTGTPENKMEWSATSGIMAYEYPNKKYISRYNIRMQMEENAVMHVFIEYDSSGDWENAGTVAFHGTGTMTLPVKTRRCDHMRLRLAGYGNVKIFSISRILMQGSDK